jgi:hypothetical protein
MDELSAHTIHIEMSQSDMDQDCIYARDGGIKYFVFGWYGVAGEPGGGTHSMQTEWNLYQASPNNGMVNWCLNILMQSFVGYVNTDQTKLLNWVKQPNYEKVLGGRPLIILGPNESNTTGVAAAITTFRATCAANGAGDPYVVVMNFNPSTASSAATAIGAQCITTYAFPPNASYRYPFSSYATNQASGWGAWIASGKDVILNLTSGWNLNPAHSSGYPGDIYERCGIEAMMYDRIEIATPAELVTFATNAKSYMTANPAAFPANTALWYAWSEHTEGGFLRPTWSLTGPNKARLDALTAVHNS